MVRPLEVSLGVKGLIQLITQNNNFPQKLIQNLSLQIQCKKTNQNKKLTTFTYYSPTMSKITNLFKHTNIGIAFKSTSTLQQLTKPKQVSNTQELDKSSIYNLTCNTCPMSYMYWTNKAQYKIRDIKNTYDIYDTMNPNHLMQSTS